MTVNEMLELLDTLKKVIPFDSKDSLIKIEGDKVVVTLHDTDLNLTKLSAQRVDGSILVEGKKWIS